MWLVSQILFLSFIILLSSSEDYSMDLLSKFNQHEFKLNFERAEMVSYDKSICKQAKIVTFKYNRTTTVLNYTEELLVDLDYGVDVEVQAYKRYSNRYIEFPVRFRVNFCDALEKNIFGMQAMKRCGNYTSCPQIKNVVLHSCNFRPDETKFPPLIPDGAYMLELNFLAEKVSKTPISKWHAYGTIYRPIKNKYY